MLKPRNSLCSDSSPLLFLESESLMDAMFVPILTEMNLFAWCLKNQIQAMLLSISDHCVGFLAHADLPSKPSCFFYVYLYHSRWISSVMWHSQQQLFPRWRRIKALWWLFLPSQVSVFNLHKCWPYGQWFIFHHISLCPSTPQRIFKLCVL